MHPRVTYTPVRCDRCDAITSVYYNEVHCVPTVYCATCKWQKEREDKLAAKRAKLYARGLFAVRCEQCGEHSRYVQVSEGDTPLHMTEPQCRKCRND